MMETRQLRLARILLAAEKEQLLPDVSRRQFLKTTGVGLGSQLHMGGLVKQIMQGKLAPQMSLFKAGEKMGLAGQMLSASNSGIKGGPTRFLPNWRIYRDSGDEISGHKGDDEIKLRVTGSSGWEDKAVFSVDQNGRLVLDSNATKAPEIAEKLVGTSIDGLQEKLDHWIRDNFKTALMKEAGYAPDVIERVQASESNLKQLADKLGYVFRMTEQKWNPTEYPLWTTAQKQKDRKKISEYQKNVREESKRRKQLEEEQGKKEETTEKLKRLQKNYPDYEETHGPMFWEQGKEETWASRRSSRAVRLSCMLLGRSR
jgi:hypothetical protein